MSEHEVLKSRQHGENTNRGTLSDKIAQFIALAAKTSSNPYYTQSEKINLQGIGEGLGLPHIIIEQVINSHTANNARVLKEIAAINQDLRAIRAEYAYITYVYQQAKQSETYHFDNVSSSSGKKQNVEFTASSSSQCSQPTQTNPAAPIQYQTSITGLQNHIDELKITTGGEGDFRQKSTAGEKERHHGINTDKTTLPLVSLHKKFTFDK